MARGVPSTVFLPFCFPLRRNSPVGQGAASAFNRAERDANGDYANRVGDGLQNRDTAGFDSRNRLSSDTDKRDGYMPPLVLGFAVSQGSPDQ